MVSRPTGVVVLALLTLAGAIPIGGAGGQTGPSPTIEATVQEQGLRVNVSGNGSPLKAQLVLTHEDPLAGSVVDRVVPVDLEANASATVSVGGLEPAANRSVRLLEANTSLPNVSNVSSLPNGSGIEELPSLGNLTVLGGDDEEMPSVRVPAYPITRIGRERESSKNMELVSTNSGLLVAVYTDHKGDPDTYDYVATDQIVARISRDGGQTFGPQIPLHEPVENATHAYISASRERGSIVSIVFTQAAQGSDYVGPIHVRLDAATGQVCNSRSLFEDEGPVIVEVSDLPSGNLLAAADEPPGPIWRISSNGSRTRVLDFSPPEGNLRNIELAPGQGSHVGVFWTVGRENWTVDTWMARSSDAGQSFTEPERIPSLSNRTLVKVTRARATPDGGLHASLSLPELAVRDEPTNGLYARVPPQSSEAQIQRMANGSGSWAPPAENARTPTLTSADTRVWAFWSTWETGTHKAPVGAFAIESTDGGSSFGSPYLIEAVAQNATWDGRLRLPGPSAILPGGRPVILGLTDREHLVSLPLFDPLAGEHTGLTEVDVRPTGEENLTDPDRNRTPPGTAGNQTEDDRESELGNESAGNESTASNSSRQNTSRSNRTLPNATSDPANQTPANATGNDIADREQTPNATDGNGSLEPGQQPVPLPVGPVLVALVAIAWLARRPPPSR